jgi:serine/threonine-protein kinase
MSEASGIQGEFRLLHKIGEGGMADVYLAERLGDDGFRTRVALKRLHRGLAMDQYFIRQLVREARVLGQLEHANIVKVFDLRRMGDEYYVVMEYVDGIDLAQVIKVHRNRKTRIPRPFFFHVALSLAEALAYAHSAVDENGNATPLIHRDIKPSNVMLSRRGIVKLTDFGIAHVGDGSITGGLVQGTANYMSPEQAFGEDRLSAASDVYSLGAVFYEMLCGKPLVDGDNYLKAIHQVRERRVSLQELEDCGVEPGLRMVAAKMLAGDIHTRYQEMESIRNDLQFVAERLKVDLSWHRIRAYVGRLMGILGRAPDRATLSGILVPEEIREAAAAAQQLGPMGPEVKAEAPLTPATPPPMRRALAEANVTHAVRKDLLDGPDVLGPEGPDGGERAEGAAPVQRGAPQPASVPPAPPQNWGGESTRVYGGQPAASGLFATGELASLAPPLPQPIAVPTPGAGPRVGNPPTLSAARIAQATAPRASIAPAPAPPEAWDQSGVTLPLPPGAMPPVAIAPPEAWDQGGATVPLPPGAPPPGHAVAPVAPPSAWDQGGATVALPPGAQPPSVPREGDEVWVFEDARSGELPPLPDPADPALAAPRKKKKKRRRGGRQVPPTVLTVLLMAAIVALVCAILVVYWMRTSAEQADAVGLHAPGVLATSLQRGIRPLTVEEAIP